MGDIEARAESGASALLEACELFGVEPRYWDIWGNQREASEGTLKAILNSLGVDASSEESLARAVRESRADEWARSLPSTLVISAAADFLPVSMPESQAAAEASFSIDLENGGRMQWKTALGDLPSVQAARLESGGYVRKQAPLPSPLPLGYHQVRVSVAGGTESASRLIVCPDRAYEPEWLQTGRAAGIGVSLYGLRSGRNWGCGDFTSLKALIGWCAAEAPVSFIALNPLHSIANRAPYNTSPYLPNSSFYRNHIYLDIEAIEDFRACPGASALRNSAAQEIEELRAAPLLEYERVSRLKLRFLKALFRRFLSSEYRAGSERARAFRTYVEREGVPLQLFAVHEAIGAAQHRADPNVWNWRAWPAEYQDPSSPEVRAFAEKNWRSVLFYKYIQWQLDLQLAQAQSYAAERGLRIGLYHDLALATDGCGGDVWAHREFYAKGCRVGAPPDNFAPGGQDWGFPPPNSRRHFEDGYRLFSESIRQNGAHGGALRIDHVMRFFRLYWIPNGEDAASGAYVRERYQDLLRILALESVRGRFLVVGEDLGTVPDYVREELRDFGVLSYRLFYFEQDYKQGDGGRFRRPEEYPRQALVAAATHDLPTLAGFWQARDIAARKEAGIIPDDTSYSAALAERDSQKQKILDLLHGQKFLPDWVPRDIHQIPEFTGELHNAIVGFLASTPSQLFLVSLEDLFKETEQQNLPGTTAEYPNWRRKTKVAIEELNSEPAHGYAAMFRNWLQVTGRANTGGQV